MRAIIAFLLISSFAFLALPKEWLHEHDHHSEEEQTNECNQKFEEDCFVCDFNYASLSSPIGVPLSFKSQQVANVVIIAKPCSTGNVIEDIVARGPPNFV